MVNRNRKNSGEKETNQLTKRETKKHTDKEREKKKTY